ncbi:MAG: aspartate aminotransferase family protein [Oscillospiraceae bacterium]|jgi:acetylornithine/N-succinyldiaminopimelate aminotransferase|nr:aspartate aminotransferase family protein [Oscillospiraceae bacterium]
MSIIDKTKQYIADTYGRFPLTIVKGSGATCFDDAGKEYVDLTSGIGVNALGFCDKGWADAVYAQLTTLQHTSNLFYTEPGAQLAERLIKRSGMSKVFFGNSGAEANEGAIKAARKYGHKTHGADCSTVITLNQSFHGRTLATLTATGQEQFHKEFFPFPQGFKYASPYDIEDVKKAVTPDVCAVMIELMQGEGGGVPLEKEYVKALAKLCKEKEILLIVDEVQTGIGRTGTLFAFQQFDITPDIVTCAKGLGGGLPIGAVLFADNADVFQPGDHASTFGANPAVCAGACYVLDKLDDAALTRVTQVGNRLKEELLKLPKVKAVYGLGMMIICDLDGIAAKDAVNAGLAEGVITLTAKERLRLLPPLTISDAELKTAIERLRKVL